MKTLLLGVTFLISTMSLAHASERETEIKKQIILDAYVKTTKLFRSVKRHNFGSFSRPFIIDKKRLKTACSELEKTIVLTKTFLDEEKLYESNTLESLSIPQKVCTGETPLSKVRFITNETSRSEVKFIDLHSSISGALDLTQIELYLKR